MMAEESGATTAPVAAALNLPLPSAVLALHRAYYSRSLKLSERANLDLRPFEEQILAQVESLQVGPCMDILNRNRVTQCTCLSGITMGIGLKAKVVTALKNFALLKREEQWKTFYDWTIYAASTCRAMAGLSVDKRKRVYILPGSSGAMVCRNAICHLLGYGCPSLLKVISLAKRGQVPVNALSNNSNSRTQFDFNGMMHAFFVELSELSTPRATRVVVSVVNGVAREDLRDDLDSASDLPPSFTKRRVYGRFLAEHGWKLKLDSIGKIVSMSKDDVVIDGKNCKEMPSWTTFLRYWKKNFPLIRIQNAREDICNDCYVFSNEHKYRDQRLKDGLDSDGSSVADSDDDDRFHAMLEKEERINDAHHHVHMARAQREFFNLKKAQAVADVGKPKAEQCHTFVADYCQNMGLPHFGSEQPGETYYMSPLNVYTFGVVDCSTVPSHLAAYVYLEGEAQKKGGNSVVSLIWAELIRKDLIPPHPMLKSNCDDWEPVQELNLFFDNCGGQNKNRMVLRLLHLLVGLRVAKTVRAAFLVRGHTKNDCDRLFNLLKKEYRKSNVYTPDDLMQCLNTCADVTAIRVAPDVFIDFDTTQSEYFHQPTAINANHVFTVHHTDPSVLLKQEYHGGPTTSQSILLPIHNGTNWMNSHYRETKIETAPGMKDIKWVELYSKIGKYVPEEKKKEWYCYHTDPGLVRKEKVKRQSKESKRQRKERTVTVDSAEKVP
jgi:hypothetical protein